MEKVRTRFPPSPTGHLHLGGARTALFNWLFARHHKGEFVLRMEDTDRERSSQEYVDAILEALEWLGLNWDEGPYFQTERIEIYYKYIEKLLDEGKAYYCECTPEELERKRKEALARKEKPAYDRTCRDKGLGPGPNRVVRFKAPLDGTTIVDDLIKGPTVFANKELDDLIILRSDGLPTYNFAVVIDDATMNINYVIRGDDHLNNTPRQIQIYEALGFPLPKFAHLPMVMGPDRSRLSKRHGALSVLAYRDKGYLPYALNNFLVRLGWSFGDQEFFTMEELIEKFSLDNVGRSAGVFNPDKLLDLNAKHIRATPSASLVDYLIPFLEKHNLHYSNREFLISCIESVKTRSKTLEEMVENMAFYIVEDVVYEEKARRFLQKRLIPIFYKLKDEILGLDEFSEKKIEDIFRSLCKEHDLKLKDIAQPVRVALTGRTVSPGLFEVMNILGRQKIADRLKKAIEYMEKDE